MDYLTVRETAETWNLSLRTVQQLCAQGRIPGAKKFGKFWAIPAGAVCPLRSAGRCQQEDPDSHPLSPGAVPGGGGGHAPRPPAGHRPG